MLIDPRARVHATTGILPTGVLELPPDQSQGTISALDLSLFSAPVLRGAGALAIPAPSESGYAVSYVDQDHGDGGALEWVVTQVAAPAATAVWAYTPQEVREGWLRLNPLQLGFDLADAQGKPVVRSGQPNTLTLTVTNRSRRTLTFRHGPPVAEGAPPSGSVFYVHLGTLVAQEDVAQIPLSPPGWTFRYFASPQYGAYWAAAPAADLSLPASGSLAIAVGD